jgi:hypothetical protein
MLLISLENDVLHTVLDLYNFLSSQFYLACIQRSIWYDHQSENTLHTHICDTVFTPNLVKNCNDKPSM